MKNVILTLAALALSGTAMAGPSWTYVDLGYVVGDSDGKNNDVDGFSARGSMGWQIWHVQLDYVDVDFDEFDGSIDGYDFRIGLHPAATDNTDFVLDLGYGTLSLSESGSSDYDVDVLTLRTGTRTNVGDNLELRAFVTLQSLDGDASDDEGVEIGYQVGAQYNFSDAWSVGADAQFNGAFDDLANIYVRWSFGDVL